MGQIELKQVTKNFGDTQVIPTLDLIIQDGEFTVFVGPSGCGKSTLLRLIAGLEDITTGNIEIDGKDATDVVPAKRGLAMVFQSYALYPHMSVRKNIAFPLRMAKLDKAEITERVEGAASASGSRLAVRLCANRLRSCLMNLCPTLMPPCVSVCGLKFPSCINDWKPRWSM